MDHAFELAFNLLDEAAGRIGDQRYGITRILCHNHGPILLTSIHHYAPETGHRLLILANDDHGPITAVEATAPDLHTTPVTRILTVFAGDLTFHTVPGTWSYRATAADHTYTLIAGVGDEPMWTTTIDHTGPVVHDTLDHAVAALLAHHGTLAAT